MNAVIPKEELTAWERWEVGSFDRTKTRPSAAGPQKDAPAVHLPTAEEVERIHHDAHKQGYAAGYEEGTARARMEALRLHTLVEHLDTALAELDRQVAEELLALALEVARQVVRETVAVRPETILQTVRDALLQLPHQHATIYLHPEDASLARSYLGDQLSHAGHRILEEPALTRGGLRIEAGGSHLDATLETRWQRVLEGLGTQGTWVAQEENGTP